MRDAREKRGVDIASMARKLHIRPDILKAIEGGDFDRTPARGYTRNMVRSYANILGLNASRITEMYLNEVHAFETGRPQSGADYTNGYNSYVRHRSSGYSRSAPRYEDEYEEDALSDSRGRYDNAAPSRSRSNSRADRFRASSSSRYNDSFDDSPDSVSSYGRSTRSSTRRQTASSRSRQASAEQGGYERGGATLRQRGSGQRSSSTRRQSSPSSQNGRTRRSADSSRNNRSISAGRLNSRTDRTRRSSGGSSRSRGIGEVYVGRTPADRNSSNRYSSMYSGGTGNSRSAVMDKLPFLGIVAVVAVIVIIILVLLFNGSKQSADNIPDIPISGLTDTSNPEGSINSNVTETAPTEAVFRYAVDDGSQSWIEIYENGSDEPSFAGVVTGPDDQEFKVTDKLVIRTANPAPVHIAVDGNALQFTEEEDSAYYRCEVDFKTILDDWKKEHPTISISSASSSSSS